jgi:peptidoglycan lytic transglycosylase
MTRPFPAALLAALATALLAAPPVLAASGGSGVPPASDDDTLPSTTISTSDDTADPGGVTLKARGGPLLGRKVTFSGAVAGDLEGRTISVQRRDPDDGWVEVATAVTDADGAFRVRWKARPAGTFAFRAVMRRADTSAGAAEASDSMTLRIYKSTLASTFYDRRTACGTLRRSTLGVAHKSLPCGTKVAFYYRGRTITLPVVDRGPYRRGYSWDLTEAAAAKLRFSGLGRVGSLVVSRPSR